MESFDTGKREILEGTRKLFPSDYEKFRDAMIDAANDRELPVTLHIDDVKDFTLKDFQDAFSDFNIDTSLELRASLSYCHKCGKMHVELEVDWPDRDPEEKVLLQ